MTFADLIRYEVPDDIAVLSMCQTRTHNALSADLLDGLTTAIHRGVGEGARAVVLRSEDRVFSAGGDLSGLNAALDEGQAAVEKLLDQLHDLVRTFRALPIPVVAAVGGPAIGAGVALALAADVRLATPETSFSTGYVAVGASPDGGASYHLARAMGGPRALSSMLTNRRVKGDELLSLGLVDLLVDGKALDEAAIAMAAQLARIPRVTLQATRSLIYSATEHSLDHHLDVEKERFLEVAMSEGFRDGIAAFSGRPATPATPARSAAPATSAQAAPASAAAPATVAGR